MTVKNAKSLPMRYYGLHMAEGVAEYREPGKEPYRIFIGEEAIKNMDPTFSGRPMYVRHVEEVDLENLQKEMDGVVVRSFFNPADGKHWAEFIAISDRAHEAIRNKWQLSNAYVPTEMGQGGMWHGVDYQKEVLKGEGDHIAFVPDPRYEESIILTPEEFKEYNEKKERELQRLANSKNEKGNGFMKLNLFKRAKIENEKATDLEGLMVELPKSKVEISLVDLVTEMDTIKNMHGYANGDHMVKVGDEEMSVNDLVKKHMEMCNEMDAAKEKKENDAEDGDPDDSLENAEEKEEEGDKKENAEDESKEKEEEEKKKNSADREAAAKKAAAKAKADKLKNANLSSQKEETVVVELGSDQVNRGRELF